MKITCKVLTKEKCDHCNFVYNNLCSAKKHMLENAEYLYLCNSCKDNVKTVKFTLTEKEVEDNPGSLCVYVKLRKIYGENHGLRVIYIEYRV